MTFQGKAAMILGGILIFCEITLGAYLSILNGLFDLPSGAIPLYSDFFYDHDSLLFPALQIELLLAALLWWAMKKTQMEFIILKITLLILVSGLIVGMFILYFMAKAASGIMNWLM